LHGAGDPVEVARGSGVHATIAAAIAPAGNTDQVPILVTDRLEDIWATRVTLAGVDAAANLATAHLDGGVDAGAEASLATIVHQVEHVHLHEVAGDATTAKEGAPAGSPAHGALPVLGTVWDADWNDVVVVDLDWSIKLHQRDVVSEGGRAVLRVVDDTLHSLRLNPGLLHVTIVTADIQNVDSRVGVAKWTVSSGDHPHTVDERTSANEATVASHGSHPAPIASNGLVATDDLVVGCAGKRSLTTAWRVDGSLSGSSQNK